MTKTDTVAGFVDLSGIVPVDSISYEILKPGSTEGTGWFIELADASHEQAVAWSNEQTRKGLRRQSQLEALQLNGRKIKPEDKDPVEQKRDNIGWVVSRIIGWNPVKLSFISPDPIQYSEKAAFDVLSHPKMGFALIQLVEVISDDRSFTKASATS
ncbi:MAG: hypothetical protein ABS35_15310 [Kaistia sp. SCN 65-12]|nr:MAG: hypothetical protein ABS35_15310 [Kaistia sp. SCN 65-12]